MATTVETRQKVHALVDDLRPEQLPAVLSLIEQILDIEDDEPLTPEDCEALDRAEEWFKHNEGIPHEEILAEFGLTIDDFPLKKNGS
jgi:hypothetical protein